MLITFPFCPIDKEDLFSYNVTGYSNRLHLSILYMKKNKNSTTIRDVARLAGVSVATVSRFLNNTAPLSEQTHQRVQQAMADLNFTPHPAARNLATNRTHAIGLVLNDIGGDFFTPLLEGAAYVKVTATITDADSGSDFNAGKVMIGIVPAGRYNKRSSVLNG